MISHDPTARKDREFRPYTLDITSRVKDGRYLNPDGTVLTLEFPDEFIKSPRRKFVYVFGFRYLYCQNPEKPQKVQIPPIVGFHSSIVQDQENDEQFICWNDQHLAKPKLYEQYSSERYFRVWFKNEFNNEFIKFKKFNKDGSVSYDENKKMCIILVLGLEY